MRLKTDPTQSLFDRFGRLLAYVNLRSNGADLGRSSIGTGWAKVYVFRKRFRRYDRYRNS